MSFASTLKQAWAAWWSPTFAASQRVPLWATLTVTLLWNTAIGLALTAVFWVMSSGRLDLGRMLWMNLLTAHCIGFAIFAVIGAAGRAVGEARIDAWPGPKRGWFFSLLVLAGVFIGYAIAFVLIGIIDQRFVSARWFSGWFVASVLLVWAVLSLLFWRFYADRARIAEAERQRAAEQARAEQLGRQALDAQLRTLQAQIEPHFLFNTLANVVSLIDTRPADARRMLERMIDLLRGSLSASRARETTLGAELDLLRAYLEILSIRMAGRLQFAIDAPVALRARPLAPLLLQPLVENAIQHGLEPKVEGGRLRVSAALIDGMLELVVEDDGVGFGAVTRGGGVGLSNLRERLEALHGSRARMSIEDAQPGTRVRLRLPQPEAATVVLAAGAAAAAA